MFLGCFAIYSWTLIDWYRCVLLVCSSLNVDLTHLPVCMDVHPHWLQAEMLSQVAMASGSDFLK